MRVLLIAGHGAGDVGAYGNGCYEADLTRDMVKLIHSQNKPFETVVADTSKNWYDYVCKSKKGSIDVLGYDYVLEIHFNAIEKETLSNGKTKGTEIYIPKSEESFGVETNIVKNISQLGLYNRGVKRYNYSLITHIRNKGVPAALLEICFIDDVDDMAIFKKSKTDIALAIINGIATGFGIEESEGLTLTQYEELKAEIDKLKVKTGYYNYIDENMNESYKPTVQKLVSQGKLQGNENGELMLTTDMMRILTVLDRCGVFD